MLTCILTVLAVVFVGSVVEAVVDLANQWVDVQE
jgi:hypothetical protein